MELTDFLERNPCVRIVVPFIIGIIIGNYFPIPILPCIFILAVTIAFAIFFYNKTLTYGNRWIPGMFVCFGFLILGLLLINTQSNTQIRPTQVNKYRANILTPPSQKNKYYKADLQVEAANISGSWHNIDTKITATFECDSAIKKLKAGQTIELTAQIDSLTSPKNPFGFDYAKYLQTNGINGSIFLKSGKWRVIDANVKGISQHALNMRQHLIGLLEKSGLSGNELGLASTLVLGYKNNIDAEIKQAYMNAGAMHVLAVSGMHVGIVYLALDILMKIFGGNFLYRQKQLLIIIMLWGYAFLTGLSPSVMRATVMFSMVIIGKITNQETSIYNSLGFAALCLLLYNPMMLFKAGFQLSCVAVVGIVFFQPKIANIFKIKNKIINYLWQLTSVSIAAQIATFPFCIYYFERTPVYFWLSNVIVSPGATILIILTMLLLITSPISCVTTFFGFITKWFTKAMNFLVISIANLPFSTIENTRIAIYQSVAIAFAIISIYLWLKTKKYNRLLLATSILTIFVIFPINLKKIVNYKQKAICIYHNFQNSAIQFVSGNNSFWIDSDSNQLSALVKDANQYWNIIKNEQIKSNNNTNIILHNNFFAFDKICGLIINDTTPIFSLNDTLNLDYLIVSGTPNIKPRQIPRQLHIDNIIIEASVKPWIAKDWEQRFAKCNIHNIKKDGAFIFRWEN